MGAPLPGPFQHVDALVKREGSGSAGPSAESIRHSQGILGLAVGGSYWTINRGRFNMRRVL